MSKIVNTTPSSNINNNQVDFGWHSSNALSILSTTIGQFTTPYGLSTLSSNLTTPASTATPFAMTVANASTFVGGGGSNLAGTSFGGVTGQYPAPVGTIYVYSSPTNWALVGYTIGPAGQAPITGNTFNYCFVINGHSGGTSLSFSSGLQVYDPRWVTYLLPLSTFTTTNVTFDAIDSAGVGLPNSKNASIVSYHWDFGNGTQADGPVVETQYWYTGQLNIAGGTLAAPTQVVVTLTAVDIYGLVHYVTHPITFGGIYTSSGGPYTPAYVDVL